MSLMKRTGDNGSVRVSHQLSVQVEGPGVASGDGGGVECGGSGIGGVDSRECGGSSHGGSGIGGVSDNSLGGEMLGPGSCHGRLID